jgi:hypothetical protein
LDRGTSILIHRPPFQNRYDNAFPNLLATVKRATPVTSGRFDTVIMPAGLPDIEKFSKADVRLEKKISSEYSDNTA